MLNDQLTKYQKIHQIKLFAIVGHHAHFRPLFPPDVLSMQRVCQLEMESSRAFHPTPVSLPRKYDCSESILCSTLKRNLLWKPCHLKSVSLTPARQDTDSYAERWQLQMVYDSQQLCAQCRFLDL